MRKKAERPTRSSKKATQTRLASPCRTTRPISAPQKQRAKPDIREVKDPKLANAIIVAIPDAKAVMHAFDCSIQSRGELFYLVLAGTAPNAVVRIVERKNSFLFHYNDAAIKAACAREAKYLSA